MAERNGPMSGLNRGDRVRKITPEDRRETIDSKTAERLRDYAGASPEVIERRIAELEREWDVERTLDVQASLTALLGLALGLRKDKRWFWLTAINQGFLLHHAIQGWCPPVWLHRQFGVRTRPEIEAERTALKILRGDFESVTSSRPVSADRALRVAAGTTISPAGA